MPSASELVAHGRNEEEICRLIGADWLVYQNLEDLIASSQEGNPDIRHFECSVFDGRYVTGDVDQGYLDRVDALRNDAAKTRRQEAEREEGAVIGLHNEVS
jgi:amidophosphoribosyltransferase